jgi:hypothetical protein
MSRLDGFDSGADLLNAPFDVVDAVKVPLFELFAQFLETVDLHQELVEIISALPGT